MQFVLSPTFNMVTHFCPWCMQTLQLTPRETLCLSQLLGVYQYYGLAGDGRFYCMLSTSAYSMLEHAQAGVTISSQGQAGPLSIDKKALSSTSASREAYHSICTQVCGTGARAAACTI